MNESGEPICDVCVIGAGPAGLAAAIAAAEGGAAVTVCERQDRAGRKLLATGGGRCNLTNTLEPDELLARLGRGGRFAAGAVWTHPPSRLREWMATLGVATAVEGDFAVYPASRRAADVRNALLDRCRALGAAIRVRCGVRELRIDRGRLIGLETDQGPLAARAAVLAAGSRAWPDLGGAGLGYDLARIAGHAVAAPTPAAVGLVSGADWPGRIPGVALPAARVWLDHPGCDRRGVAGAVLMTHRGLSGPAVLDLSADAAELLARGAPAVTLRLAISGDSPDAWGGRFERWRRDHGARPMRTLLARELPGSLVELLLAEAGAAPDVRPAQCPKPVERALIDRLTGWAIPIVATEGFERAMVARGGVETDEVRPDTLESTRVKGLYFAGEVLDVDGPCGGFNLTWAFASGLCAGAAAADERRR